MPHWLNDTLLAQLKRDPWFGQVSAGFSQSLLEMGTLRAMQSGERLFLRGDAPDGLYLSLIHI